MGERIQACNLCEGTEFELLAIRSDNAPVVRCKKCGHGALEFSLDDPASIYGDTYYAGDTGRETGYADYLAIAEHGVAWAAGFVRLLAKGGSVLDIGCADGHLLKKLLSTHKCFGIEMNERMSEICRDGGITMIGRDLLDPAIIGRYEGAFDVVSAIAVFEHIPDFDAAVRCAIKLLRPGGALLFEVPLVSEISPSEIWFRTSLEHIHYPSERGLRRYFKERLDLPLVGAECVIRDYASTYIGVVSNGPARAAEDSRLFERVVHAPVAALLSPEERRCRCLLDLIHAAQPNRDLFPILAELDKTEINPLILRRISQVWDVDSGRHAAIIAQAAQLRSVLENGGRVFPKPAAGDDENRWEVTQLQEAIGAIQNEIGHLCRVSAGAARWKDRDSLAVERENANALRPGEALEYEMANAKRLEAALVSEAANYRDACNALAAETQRAGHLTELLESRTNDLTKLELALAAESSEVIRLHGQIRELEDRLEVERHAAVERNSALEAARKEAGLLNESLVAQRTECADLRAKLHTELQENQWLQAQLATERKETERLEDLVLGQRQDNERLKRGLENKQAEIENLYAYAVSQNGEARSMKDSLSWRITRPLRAIAAVIGVRRG